MSDIDFGQLSEALNDKSDRDLRNVDTTAKADAVIDYQEPTSANNYTWYRKYKSGWVEQGGIGTGNSSITLPIEMADTTYILLGTITQNDNASLSIVMQSKTTTSFWCRTTYSGQAYNYGIAWQVSGQSAN